MAGGGDARSRFVHEDLRVSHTARAVIGRSPYDAAAHAHVDQEGEAPRSGSAHASNSHEKSVLSGESTDYIGGYPIQATSPRRLRHGSGGPRLLA
jgi:hypothetical protein